MRTHLVRLLVVIALAAPGTALAQGQAPAKKPAATKQVPATRPAPAKPAPTKKAAKKTAPAKTNAAGQRVKNIDITEGDDVEGGVAGATGTDVTVIGQVTHSSLLRLRMDFNDHLIRSAERL